MNIWFINHYGVPLKYWPGNRTPQFAKYLLRAGHNVRVIAASTVHNSDINLIKNDALYQEEVVDAVPYTYIKCRQYEGNGIGRIRNMLEFPIRLDGIYKQFCEKPDAVLGSSLTPFACVEAIRIARHYGIKSIVEIRDLWPETAVAYGAINKNNPFLTLMYWLEKRMYEYADDIIFTFAGGYDYIKERGWEHEIPKSKVHYINNGVDLEAFDYNKKHYRVDDADLQNEDILKIVYAGSIRLVNDLGKLLDVAKLVKNPKVKFLVWGKGDELAVLRKRVEDENINNVVFKGYVEKKYIPYITGHADFNIAHGSGKDIKRFGSSPNKVFDYMAAGKPIIVDYVSNYDPVIQCDAGVEVKNPTPENIAKTIEDVVDINKETYYHYCKNARKGAEEYDFKNLTKKLLKIMIGENAE